MVLHTFLKQMRCILYMCIYLPVFQALDPNPYLKDSEPQCLILTWNSNPQTHPHPNLIFHPNLNNQWTKLADLRGDERGEDGLRIVHSIVVFKTPQLTLFTLTP